MRSLRSDMEHWTSLFVSRYLTQTHAHIFTGMGSRPACSRPRRRPRPVVFEAKARPGRGQVKAKSAKTSDYRVLECELKAKVVFLMPWKFTLHNFGIKIIIII